jgi:F420-dependent oxidoreductase-like protein
MDVRVFAEPQFGASYQQQLQVAQAAEDLGFEGFFRSDHYLTMAGSGLPGPSDTWVTLAGLARETRRLRLGALLSSATFRLPGVLAVTVAQLDQMSGGRVECGLGAGWFEPEHLTHGIPFPGLGERFDRLEEQLAILRGFWTTPPDELFSFTGRHYRLVDAPPLPRPVQSPGPPLIVGGRGAKRTPQLAARFADEFNVPFEPAQVTGAQYQRVRVACQADGRDPAELTFSHAIVLCCGRTDADLRRRAAVIGRDLGDLRANTAAGTPEEVVERLREYQAVGAQRCYLQIRDFDDLEHLQLVAEQVLPHL